MANKKQSRRIHQQKVILGAVVAVIAGVLLYLSSLVVKDAPLGEYVEGTHYYLLENPRRLRGEKVEIMEFFSYGCVHCYNFDDDLSAWVEAREDKITFLRSPAISNEAWRILGRAYYTLEELDLLGSLHSQMFYEIHEARRNITSAEQLSNLLLKEDSARQQFLEVFKSVEVTQKVNRADELARRFKVATVPNIIVNGKYLVQAGNGIGLTRMLDVMDHLIEKETKTKAVTAD